ncbi:MAG: glycoside hydrolase family 15 protein [Candidatus Nanoperiomorbaceae bacterium]
MARPVILSNGSLAVGLDQFGQVRDFYYPHVGTENHVSQRISPWRIGIFVDNAISWLDNGQWNFTDGYDRPTPRYWSDKGIPRLIGTTAARNDNIGIAIEFDDFVDVDMNIFSRNFHVINLRNETRSVKLFTHQAFLISESNDGHDTAQFVPEDMIFGDAKDVFDNHHEVQPTWCGNGVICHYKGPRVFMIDGRNLQTGDGFDSFAIGNYGEFQESGRYTQTFRDGVWRDAEDGQLSRNPVERLATDSVLEFDFNITGNDSARAHYAVAAGKTFAKTADTLAGFRSATISSRLVATNNFWRDWIRPAVTFVSARLPENYHETFLRALLVAKSHVSRSGAVIAALDTGMLDITRDAYVDCWPRDAANILTPFLEVGLYDELLSFFTFAQKVITPQGFFWQMYRADAQTGPSSHAFMADPKGGFLLPIQTDETAAVLQLLSKTLQKTKARASLFEKFKPFYDHLAVQMADFLCDYVETDDLPKPSYELWEVALETTLFTTGLTIAALSGASECAELFGDHDHAKRWLEVARKMHDAANQKFWNNKRQYFYRGFRVDGQADDTIDIASLHGAELGKIGNTATAYHTFCQRFGITDDQVHAPRFENDDYHGFENPWFIASFWLAESESANAKFTRNSLGFAKSYLNRYNVLSEQLTRGDLKPIDPAPLAWSQGEFMTAMLKAFNKPV